MHVIHRTPRIALAGAALCALGAGAGPAPAVEFGAGDWRATLDTTLSHGVAFRVEDHDDALLSDVNGDDGNRNYGRGLIGNVSRFTSELDLQFGNVGAFARVTGFQDYENQSGDRDRKPLSGAAKSRVGRDVELLDAYVSAAVDVGDSVVDARIGSQVLNWGESTFIQGGINAINPFDVARLRLPGSELREALVPVPMVSASVAPTDNLSVEGFYQIGWEETEIDPVGSYFSVTDYVGAGAERVEIDLTSHPSLGAVADLHCATRPGQSCAGNPDDEDNYLFANRLSSRLARDSGQWGVAFRWFAEELNDTEFGFYYVNYHSRLPLVSGHSGTFDSARAAAASFGAAAGPLVARARALGGLAQQFGAAAQAGLGTDDFSSAQKALRAAAAGGGPAAQEAAAAATQFQNALNRDSGNGAVIGGAIQKIVGSLGEGALLAQGLAGAATFDAVDSYARTAGYFIEYPEDIELFGFSFNTGIGATGWALQGEYSLRRDAPLQLAERKVLGVVLATLTGCLTADNPGACIGANAAAGLYDSDIPGFILRDVSQAQVTATRVFGPMMGADSVAFLTEVAVTAVHDMPGGAGVASPGEPDQLPLESPAASVGDDFNDADAVSWGYRVAARLDYNNAIGAVNLSPYTQFQHDVNGNSPSPAGSFVEGRTAVTLGLRASYLARWEAEIGYTRYAGKRNELHDRDFVSASVKYSF